MENDPKDVLHTCLSVAGARGSGKTTAVKALLRDRRARRRLILDPVSDYGAETLVVVRTKDELDTYLYSLCDEDVWSQSPLQKSARNNPDFEFSVAYTPEADNESEAAAHLAEWAIYLGDCVLLIEEAHDAARHSRVSDELIRCAKRGRHYNVGLWCVSQRPSDIDPSLRAELHSSEAFYLRLVETIDLDVLRKRRGPEFAEQVAALPPLWGYRLDPMLPEAIPFTVFPGDDPVMRVGHLNQRGEREDE